MKQKRIFKLIVKYLGKESNSDELAELDESLKANLHFTEVFKKLARTEFLIVLFMSDYDLQKAKKNVQKKIGKARAKQRGKRIGRFSVAATVIMLIGLLLFKIVSDYSFQKSGQQSIKGP